MESAEKCLVRNPDFVEERGGAVLQIWGEEGYWHIVDSETQDLLAAASRTAALDDLFKSHPQWLQQKRVVTQILESIRSGLANLFRSVSAQIENVSINVTNACNLHCATCYVPAQDRKPQKLDAAKAIRFLEKLGARLSPTATISLLGGEPFLHPEGVIALATWAHRTRHPCNVSTNGTLPFQTSLVQIRNLGLQVQVSIDGATSGTHEALRGTGTFDKALSTARELVAAGVPTTLCMVACEENKHEIGDYLRLAKALGANEARVIPLKRIGNAKNGKLTPAANLSILQKVAAVIESDPSLEKLCQSDLFGILRAMVSEVSRRESCGSGTQTLLLQADGTVYPCINNTMDQARLGTTDESEQVLRNGEHWGGKLSINNPHHPCSPCPVRRWCLAGCPGETLQRAGAFPRAHENCADLRNAITYMMWHTGNRAQSGAPQRTRI